MQDEVRNARPTLGEIAERRQRAVNECQGHSAGRYVFYFDFCPGCLSKADLERLKPAGAQGPKERDEG